MQKNMKNSLKKFNKGEIRDLVNNPFVLNVNEVSVEFNTEFKKHFIRLINKENYSKHQALKLLGINPSILGEYRIEAMKKVFIDDLKLINNKSNYRCNQKTLLFSNVIEEAEYYKRVNLELKNIINQYLNLHYSQLEIERKS